MKLEMLRETACQAAATEQGILRRYASDQLVTL